MYIFVVWPIRLDLLGFEANTQTKLWQNQHLVVWLLFEAIETSSSSHATHKVHALIRSFK